MLEQSLDIMLWALGQHDPQSWLHPSQGTQAEMQALIAECDGPFKQALDRTKYPTRYPECDPAYERAQAARWLGALEARLNEHPFLFGEHCALADMAIAPFVRQFAGVDACLVAGPALAASAGLAGAVASQQLACQRDGEIPRLGGRRSRDYFSACLR